MSGAATTGGPAAAGALPAGATMRAVRIHGFGDPDVLRVDEVPCPPAPQGDQLLVRVAAASVNGTDLGLRRGDLRLLLAGRLPIVPGFDLAGEVVACGPRVTAFGPGDRVMALLGHGGGGQAEYALVRQGRAARVPATVSLDAASTLPLAGLTALQALYGKAGLASRPHARVLVNGASGGIGSYAVQLAKLAGASVTAVASGPKLAFTRELGADDVVDYREHDVPSLTGRYDVVLDAPGKLAFSATRRLLTDDGVFVTTRPISPDVLRGLAPRSLRRGPGRFTAVMTAARSLDLGRLAALVDAGRLRPPVDAVFALADVAQAHRRAEGGVRGKVTVHVADL